MTPTEARTVTLSDEAINELMRRLEDAVSFSANERCLGIIRHWFDEQVRAMERDAEPLSNRITEYLCAGGFFNPELMEHAKVRDLLIACRKHLDAARAPFDVKRFEQAPCYLCGYNGPNYYQPEAHMCATMFHDARAQRDGGGEGAQP